MNLKEIIIYTISITIRNNFIKRILSNKLQFTEIIQISYQKNKYYYYLLQ